MTSLPTHEATVVNGSKIIYPAEVEFKLKIGDSDTAINAYFSSVLKYLILWGYNYLKAEKLTVNFDNLNINTNICSKNTKEYKSICNQ